MVTELNKMGPGTLLAEVDIKSAYCIIPVHPADRHLLGMSWKGGPLFICLIALRVQRGASYQNFGQRCRQLGWLAQTLRGTASASEPQLLRRNVASKTRPLKPWGDGTAPPFWLTYLHMPREHLATISHTLSTLTPSREQV